MFGVIKKILEIVAILVSLLNITLLPLTLAYLWLYKLLDPVVVFLDSLPLFVNIPLGVAFILVFAWLIIKVLRDFL